jgi:serine/threonine protein kinase
MLDPDQLLGSYKLISRIGAGGMGEVWKAEDTRLGRAVAIKILPARIASDTEAIARMRREARTAAQLNHPNIATIHSFEEAEGRTFIVMEFVAGEPLSALIQGGSLTEADVCRIGRNVAEALAEAHEKGRSPSSASPSRPRTARPPTHRPRDPSRQAERSRPAAHSGGLRTGSRPSRRNGTAASAAPRVQAVTLVTGSRGHEATG